MGATETAIGRGDLIWLEKHQPHGPAIAEVVASLKAMSQSERHATLARSRALAKYAQAFETAALELAASEEE